MLMCKNCSIQNSENLKMKNPSNKNLETANEALCFALDTQYISQLNFRVQVRNYQYLKSVRFMASKFSHEYVDLATAKKF